MKKRWLILGTTMMVSAMMMAGCGATDDAADAATDTTQEAEADTTQDDAEETDAAEETETKDADFTGLISPISREDGSGTRGAFIELFGIETKDADGNKIDNTTDMAEITNSTSVMLTTVQGNEYAIGYVSLDVVDDTVNAMKLEGVEPTAENIKAGSYFLCRPFVMATKGEISEQSEPVQALFDYLKSDEGKALVEQVGLITVD